MSLKQLKNECGLGTVDGRRSIEDYLQSIVNVTSQIMESVEVPLSEFSEIESRFEQSSTFEEVLVIIEHMSNLCLERMKKGDLVTHDKRRKDDKPKLSDPQSISLLGSSNYEELEKLLQKYEAEIREHIKIEQQMKIYSDSLEEKITELENACETSASRAKSFEKELNRLRAELEVLQTDKQPMKTKIQLSNGRGLAISVPKHRKTQSIDTMGMHQHTQLDLLTSNPTDPKLDTKKNNQNAARVIGSQKMKRTFNFAGKAMFSNLKNFYEDFMGTGFKIAQKGSSHSRSETESVRLPLKTLEKGKDNNRQNSKK